MKVGVPIPASGTRCGVSDVGAPPIPNRLLGPLVDWAKTLRKAGIPESPGREEALVQIAKDRDARSRRKREELRQAELELQKQYERQAVRANRGTNWRK
jgi:uncharacterized protein with von Willebrand factor type A (vWA) domain